MITIDNVEDLSKVCRIGGAAVAFAEEFRSSTTDLERLLVAQILAEHIEQIQGENNDSRNRDQMHE